jgi:hypothetical protein
MKNTRYVVEYIGGNYESDDVREVAQKLFSVADANPKVTRYMPGINADGDEQDVVDEVAYTHNDFKDGKFAPGEIVFRKDFRDQSEFLNHHESDRYLDPQLQAAFETVRGHEVQGVQYIVESNQPGLFTSSDPVEVTRKFFDLPAADFPTITRIETAVDKQGVARNFVTRRHGRVEVTTVKRDESDKWVHEYSKSIDARDPLLQAAFLVEAERRAHVHDETRGLRIDGNEVTRLQFLRHRFTAADRDTFGGHEPPPGSFAYDVQFDLADGTKAEYKHISPETLEAAIGAENIAEIEARKGDTGILKAKQIHGHEGISPEVHRAREQAAWQAQQEQQAADLHIYGPNTIERDDGLSHAEVLERAAQVRDQERAHRDGQTVEDLGNEAEARGQNIETLSDHADRQEAAATSPVRAGERLDLAPVTVTEQEVGVQADALARVHANFRAIGSDYYYKDAPDKLAFSEHHGLTKDKIVTPSNDERVVMGMVNMAEARGWKQIKVSGHPDFRRAAWMEAKLKGIAVKGFVPSEQDLADFKARQARQMRNSIEKFAKQHQTPREQVASAVAGKLLDSRIANPAVRAKALEQINIGLRKRAQSGHVPGIPVYDKSAPAKAREVQKIKQHEQVRDAEHGAR